MPLLTLNTKKTKSICFSIRKLQATESLNIRIKDEIIEQVSEEKYIGMIFRSKYKILSFAHFVFFHYIKLVFKCLNGLGPMPLCNFFERLQGSSRSTRVASLASSGNCRVIQTVLSVKGVTFWNSLPDYLKSIANYNNLKKAMKSWLIHQQTCSHV